MNTGPRTGPGIVTAIASAAAGLAAAAVCVLVLGDLAGPFVLVFAPLFVWRAWRHTNTTGSKGRT